MSYCDNPRYKNAKDAPKISFELEATCHQHPETNCGSLFMRFADTTAKVLSEDESTELGEVSCAIGATLVLSDEASGMEFYVSAREIWIAFEKAVKNHPDYERLVKERKLKHAKH